MTPTFFNSRAVKRRGLVALSPCDTALLPRASRPQPSHILRTPSQRLVILDLALGEAWCRPRLNIGTVREKGGHRVIKVCPAVMPERLRGHPTGEVWASDDR